MHTSNMDLFQPDPASAPLADRLRPRSFDEILGQDHLVAVAAPFRVAVEAGRPPSAILWGPPGVGKTTIARVVAACAGHRFIQFSAVLSGIKEVREVMRDAAGKRRLGGKTLVFIDEIHRFNKAQQDAFLPFVEAGDVVLLGATTENPGFEVIPALMSRLTVHRLRPLDEKAVRLLLEKALADTERGLGTLKLEPEAGLLDDLAAVADGDGRRVLNALEALARAAELEGSRRLERSLLPRVLQKQPAHDKAGDSHYDLASALIKSVRNSDPDAAVYWLARLLEAGEDPMFVARRLVILASEDVGLAKPAALPMAVSAMQATHNIGMPEARLVLSQTVLYLALAPKSNSALSSYEAAKKDLMERPAEPVPLQLRNASNRVMKEQGFGKDYRYAHDDAGASQMPCLPESLQKRRYYEPGSQGAEPELSRQHRDRTGRK